MTIKKTLLEKIKGLASLMQKNEIGRKKYLAAAILALILIAVIVFGYGKREQQGSEPPAEVKAGQEEKESAGTVKLSPEKLQAAGIETQKVNSEPLSAMISATAVIEFNGDKLSKVSPRVSGRVVKLLASQGDRVKVGQPLAHLDSVELDQAWSDYVKARGKAELAKKNLAREETLFEKKISPEKDVIKARQEMGEAEADLNLSVEKFRLLGIDVASMEQHKNGNKDGGHPLIPLSSAVGGVVVEKSVTQGEVVSPDKVLFTVADLSTLWVEIDIYEKDLQRVRGGMHTKIVTTAFADRQFTGTISYVGDVVDEKTRTVKARVTADNASRLLKPGMFATVSMDPGSGKTEKAIVAPEEAVLMDGQAKYVFVETGSGSFKRRDVVLGRTFGGKVEVMEGLTEGDRVVVKGAFTLKSELKKESLSGE